jgi:hypothetical protein
MSLRISLFSYVKTLSKDKDKKDGVTAKDIEHILGITASSIGSALSSYVKSGYVRITGTKKLGAANVRESNVYKLTGTGLTFLKTNKQAVYTKEQMIAWHVAAQEQSKGYKAAYEKRKSEGKVAGKAKTLKPPRMSARGQLAVDGITQLLTENDQLRANMVSLRAQLNGLASQITKVLGDGQPVEVIEEDVSDFALEG